jgi:hypothetical protein
MRSATFRWAMISAPSKSWLPHTWSASSWVLITTLRHAWPDLAKQLDHLSPVREVRLRVDDHAAPEVDESRVGIAHEVLLIEYRAAIRADLLKFHRDSRLLWNCTVMQLRSGAIE